MDMDLDYLLANPWHIAGGALVIWTTLLLGFNAAFRFITDGLLADDEASAMCVTADWKRLAAQGGSYAVSMLHSILVALLGVKHMVTLLKQPAVVQMNAMPSLEGVTDIFTASAATAAGPIAMWPRCEHTAAVFLAYLVVDFVHMAVKFPKLGGLDMLAHHVGFIACAGLSIHYRMYALGFAWLIVGEGSTPFLSLRWFFRTLGWGETLIAKLNGVLFVLLFFATRVVVYALGVKHTLMHYKLVDAPLPVARGVLVLIVLGFLLNLMWFRGIMHKALGIASFSNIPKKEEKEKTKDKKGGSKKKKTKTKTKKKSKKNGTKKTR